MKNTCVKFMVATCSGALTVAGVHARGTLVVNLLLLLRVCSLRAIC